jgi:hypothetical protein
VVARHRRSTKRALAQLLALSLLLPIAACQDLTTPLSWPPTPSPARCGDGARADDEVCDGADLDGRTCASFGFPGGTLACRETCAGFVVAACRGIPSWAEGLASVPAPAETCCDVTPVLPELELEVRFVRATATVLDVDGQPASGSLVLADSVTGRHTTTPLVAGRADVIVPASRYRVSWLGPRDTTPRGWAFVEPWAIEQDAHRELRLPAHHAVSVAVVTRGEALAPAPRRFELRRGGLAYAFDRASSYAGRLFEGDYEVEVVRERHEPPHPRLGFTVAGPAEVALSVEMTRLVGRVRPVPGEPLPADVSLTLDGETVALDAEGRFDTHVLTSTSHTLWTWPYGARHVVSAGGPARRELDLALLPDATARVRGRVVGGARAIALYPEGPRASPSAPLDADGGFDFAAPPETYAVWLTTDDARGLVRVASVQVVAGGTTELDLRVPPLEWVELTGEVTVNGGTMRDSSVDLPRASLVFRSPDLGATWPAVLPSTGPAVYAVRVPAARYAVQLYAEGPGDTRDVHADALPPGVATVEPGARLDRTQRRDFDLRLVRATVRLREGARPLRALSATGVLATWVTLSHRDGSSIAVRAADAAEFVVAARPDAYWVYGGVLAAPSHELSRRVPVRVEDGTVIDLDTGLYDVSGRVRWTGLTPVGEPWPPGPGALAHGPAVSWGDGAWLPLDAEGRFGGVVSGADTAVVSIGRTWAVRVR